MLYIFLIIIAFASFGIANLIYRKQFDKSLFKFIAEKFRIVFSKNEKRFKQFKVRKTKDEDFWLQSIKKAPKKVRNYKRLGEWYLENNNKDYAIQTLEYVAKISPNDKKLAGMLKKLREEV